MRLFNKADTTITISTRTIIKAIALTVIAYIVLIMIGNITHELTLIGVSILLAIGLNPAVGWITARIKSRSRLRATGVAYVIVIGLLIGFIAVVVPPIVDQTTKFVQGVPDSLNSLKYQDSAFGRTIRRYDLQNKVDDIRTNYSDKFGDISKPVISTAGRVGGIIVSIITVLVLTFMLLIEGPMWVSKFLAMQPESSRKQREQVMRRMYKVVTGFVNGQVLISFIAASFAAVVMFIMNAVFNASVNPLALAGIVFVCGLLPLIGNIIAASVVVVVCLISSAPLALFMGIYFIIYQQIENATLQPYIQSRANQLTPLTVFIVALLGAGLGGLLGALAAIPVAGCARILLEEFVRVRFPDLEMFDSNTKSSK